MNNILVNNSNTISKIVQNRLNKEYINYSYFPDTNTISFVKNDNLYSIKIDNFPFKPPKKLMVNNLKVEYFKLPLNIKNNLYKFFKIYCLCCSSILCENNWKISYNFLKIVNEYEFNNQIINYIINYEIIKKSDYFKNIPDDIDFIIMDYLKPTQNLFL
jgi:hypothetical protein